jgi:hypothetical protein
VDEVYPSLRAPDASRATRAILRARLTKGGWAEVENGCTLLMHCGALGIRTRRVELPGNPPGGPPETTWWAPLWAVVVWEADNDGANPDGLGALRRAAALTPRQRRALLAEIALKRANATP